MAYNKEDIFWFYLGCLFAAGSGIIFPIFATFLGDMISILAQPKKPNFNSDASNMALNFLYCAVGMLVGTVITHYIFETFACN